MAERTAEMKRTEQEVVGLGLEGRRKKCGVQGNWGGVFHSVTLGTYHCHKKIILNLSPRGRSVKKITWILITYFQVLIIFKTMQI